jgi:hypothetical protein
LGWLLWEAGPPLLFAARTRCAQISFRRALRWIFVQLKRAESEQVFKRAPDLVRFAAINLSPTSRKHRNSRCRGSIRYPYTCCRCSNCAAQVVLEEQGGSNTLFCRPARPRAGHEACPYCRMVFVPEKYYVAGSETPLLQQALAPFGEACGPHPDVRRCR